VKNRESWMVVGRIVHWGQVDGPNDRKAGLEEGRTSLGWKNQGGFEMDDGMGW